MEFNFKTRYQYRSIMDMTPLIDFAFTLLIYFMMTYHSDAGQVSSIQVNLPSATKVESAKESDVVVSINEKNEIYLNDVKYSPERLFEEFKKLKPQLKQRTVIIRGDRKSSYNTIVKIMDDLNRAGISRFTLATVKQ